MKKPDFVIIGAMKSATSTLHEQLALQPGFFMSTPKEPNFFSDDDIYKLGLKSYMHSLKLIYVIRHPIERLVSHYIHQWSQNVIRTDINQAIDEFDELINYSLYSMQLVPFIEAYGAENIHIAFSEAFRVRPQDELEKVAQFLNYSNPVIWYENLPEQNVSSQRIRRFKGYNFVVDHPLLAWLRRNLIPQSLRDAVKNKLTLKNRPVIDEQHMQKLTRIFNEDLASLGDLFGVELNLQNYKSKAQSIDVSLSFYKDKGSI